ncbi:MAG: TetR/AcrR family transcriptional regulator [Terriglobia bacterium]
MRPAALPKTGLFAARHRQAAETRASILRAAADLFAQAGLAGARTEAIASAARVNKALLYYYFKSKDRLYSAVLEDHLEEFSRRATEILRAREPARAIVLRYVSMHFDFISARPYYPRLFQRFMMSGGATFKSLAQKYFVPLGREFIGVIERGKRSREFRNVDSTHAAISLVGLTVFYFVSAPVTRLVGRVDPYAPENLATRKKEVLDFIRYGLFREPESRLS